MTELIVRAANFAAIKHSTQRRKDKALTPYINHPIGVAKSLVDCGVTTPVVIAAALLHDTLEDTKTTVAEMRAEFGDDVTNIVIEVTDDKSLPAAERKRLQITHAATISVSAKLVKLADKLNNLTSQIESPPPSWSVNRIQGYFLWAKFVTDACFASEPPNDVFSKFKDEFDKAYAAKWHYSDNPETVYDAMPPGDPHEQLELYLASL